jgi:hypothetical protein
MDKYKLNDKKASICDKIIDSELFYLEVVIIMKLIIAIAQD